MELFECTVGQRVVHKDTGKGAMIKALWRAENEVEIQFDSGHWLAQFKGDGTTGVQRVLLATAPVNTPAPNEDGIAAQKLVDGIGQPVGRKNLA